MKNKNKFNLNRTLNEIKSLNKAIKEAYVFEDDVDMYDEESYIEDEPVMGKNDDRINQIRTIALDGIQEYAQDVDSKEYDFFKKIWMMCDKACSEKTKEKEME